MTRCLAFTVFFSTVVAAATTVFFDPVTYERDVTRQRRERVERLTAADGWLTLVGLHFLNEGENRIGSAPGNEIVLPHGPGLLGTARLEQGRVRLTLAPGVPAKIDGREIGVADLRPEEPGPPTIVTIGTLGFYLIERGGKLAVRVKDSAARRRVEFAGIDYFPVDPRWRIEAHWVPFARSRQIPIVNILGQTGPALVPGKAVFTHEGQTYELLAIDEGLNEPLFFVISDATSGRETYGAARFVYAERPRGETIVLDFNLAYNPPCAFTPFATCPLPPKENRLPFAVTAGEKNYRGTHE